MKLVVGFITYNESSEPYLPYFLESLKKALNFIDLKEVLILAFDNSDFDFKSNQEYITQFLLKNPGLKIRQLKADKNIGFAKAYNLMIKEALNVSAEYFLVINPDIVLTENSLELLVNRISQKTDLAAVSPRIMTWDFKNLAKTKIIDSLGISSKSALKFFDIAQGKLYSEENKNEYIGEAKKVIAPSGASGLYRLSALEKVAEDRGEEKQYFDERFFMYKEDCDLAYRFLVQNLKVETVFDSVIYHDRTTRSLGGGLKNFFLSRREKSKKARAWSFRNQHYIFIKHFNSQNILTKGFLLIKMAKMFFFSLIFEQFLLKEYPLIIKFRK